MPVRNVASCTFGGVGRTTSLITIAADDKAGEPPAGSLFALKTEVCGPEIHFRICLCAPDIRKEYCYIFGQSVTEVTGKHRALRTTSLKKLAEHLGLHPATVSVVLNEVPGRSISQATRDRIKAAAKELNYRPSLLARSLRNRRTLSIGILVPDLSEAYHNQIVSGIGDHLMDSGYFYFTAHHRRKKHLIEEYTHMLLGRGVEGLIAIDTPLHHPFPVPAVAVAGHRPVEGVTNVVLDHRLAATLILDHLQSLGHNQIVFVRGQTFSADAEERWRYLMQVAREKRIPVKPELVIQLAGDVHSPKLGYPVIQQLRARQAHFTAVVAFNDMSAIGIIRALQDLKMNVPDDVSVIGFDDIEAAAFTVPRLTTVRQPLAEMGRIAAQCVLNRLHRTEKFRTEITVEPSFVVRESTRAIPEQRARRSQDIAGPNQSVLTDKN